MQALAPAAGRGRSFNVASGPCSTERPRTCSTVDRQVYLTAATSSLGRFLRIQEQDAGAHVSRLAEPALAPRSVCSSLRWRPLTARHLVGREEEFAVIVRLLDALEQLPSVAVPCGRGRHRQDHAPCLPVIGDWTRIAGAGGLRIPSDWSPSSRLRDSPLTVTPTSVGRKSRTGAACTPPVGLFPGGLSCRIPVRSFRKTSISRSTPTQNTAR
jgi:hypothetical protein